ncbi:MAG: hypothetical protein HUJ76_04010 [Parasporobacterium sp.]|nr:hypothetical protein [Parasporobacterium sp.]
MERQSASRASFIFCAFILILAFLMIVVPRSTISEIEKRALAEMPAFSFGAYFDGSFTSGVTQYYDDTVPARDTFKNLGNNLKKIFGLSTGNTVEVIGNVARVDKNQPETTAETGTAAEAEPAAEETETTTAEEKNSKDYRAANADATMEDGILVVYQDNHYRAIPLFGGLYSDDYANTLNYLRAFLTEDINMYCLLIPCSSQYYLPANYADYSVDHTESFDRVFNVTGDGITDINILNVLNDHNSEPIYLRTDHHWAPRGGYYAAKAFAEAAGVPFQDISTYDEHVYPGYMGSMYAYTGSANLLNDPEDFIWYSANNKYNVDYYDRSFNYIYTGNLFFDVPTDAAYCIYLGTDDQIAKVNTDVKNGRTLLLVKDSFANAMVPFLTHSFEKIFVVDQRYFELNMIEFIYANGITDVLMAHNSFSLAGAEVELLDDVIKNYTGSYIYDEAPAPDFTGDPYIPDGPLDSYYYEDTAAEEDYSYDEGYYDEGYYDEAGY